MSSRPNSSLAIVLLMLTVCMLPEVNSQDIATTELEPNELVQELDRGRADFATVFTHHFIDDGLPPEFFSARDDSLDNLQQRRDGLVMRVKGKEKWTSTNLTLQFQIVGDFDVEAGFTKLKFDGKDRSSVGIAVSLDDQQMFIPRILRSYELDERQTVRASMTEILNGDRRQGKDSLVDFEAMSGVLRLSRRGETIYYLVAEQETEDFRLVGQRTATAVATIPKGIQLRSLSNGRSSAEVVWTDVRVAAEELLLTPRTGGPKTRSLYVLTFADGTLKKIADPKPGMKNLGSAEWSSDGKTIVCDMSKGSTTTSRVVKMNADGSDFQDLGAGCMPSLSSDGRQIVYSVAGAGITKMNSDGSGVETIEARGWGTQWSPDGQYIAWGSGGNVTILNTKTDEQSQLLTDAQQQDVGHVYWNLGWSHDSKSIAFKCRGQAGTPQLAVADIGSPDGFKVLYTAADIEEDMSWLPDNKTVVFLTTFKGHSRRQFATISREAGAVPQPIPGIPDDWDVLNMDCSPDGKYAVFTGTPPPQPVEWTGK